MVVLFDACLNNFLFESGVHWRPGVYYNSGLEPRSLSQILPVGLPDCCILNMGDFLTMWIYWPFRIIQGHWFLAEIEYAYV